MEFDPAHTTTQIPRYANGQRTADSGHSLRGAALMMIAIAKVKAYRKDV
jgi:hypothetical protein